MTLYWMYIQTEGYFELLDGEREALWLAKHSDHIAFTMEVV